MDEITPKNQAGRRKIKNLLIAPKAQFGTAIAIFALGFLFISVLFGVMLYRANDLINTLVALSRNPAETAAATESTGVIMMTTYAFLLLSFLCSTLFLALTITHRYLGPMVPIQRHVKRMLEGSFDERIHLRKNDLFQELAQDLNLLAEKMQTERRRK